MPQHEQTNSQTPVELTWTWQPSVLVADDPPNHRHQNAAKANSCVCPDVPHGPSPRMPLLTSLPPPSVEVLWPVAAAASVTLSAHMHVSLASPEPSRTLVLFPTLSYFPHLVLSTQKGWDWPEEHTNNPKDMKSENLTDLQETLL